MPGLGKGLSSLIPSSKNAKAVKSAAHPEFEGEMIYQIPVEKITSNRHQPRVSFDHTEMEELVSSIKEHGILQPVIVSQSGKDQFELIAGERRWRAVKLLEMKTIPAIVRKADDQERLVLALVENIQRQDLNPIEEAQAYRKLASDFEISLEELGRRLGKSKASITNTTRLLNLPEEIRLAVAERKLTAGHARSIASLAHLKDQMDLFHKIINEQLSVREVEREAKKVVVAKNLRRIKFDPLLDDMTDALRMALGTKVNIKKRGAQGTIVINFYSDEELSDLVAKISGS